MDVAKSGGGHGGSLDPDVSTVTCPELSGQPAPTLSGFLWDDQLGKRAGGVGRSPLCLVQSSGEAHRSPSGTSLVPAQQPQPPCHLSPPPLSSPAADFWTPPYPAGSPGICSGMRQLLKEAPQSCRRWSRLKREWSMMGTSGEAREGMGGDKGGPALGKARRPLGQAPASGSPPGLPFVQVALLDPSLPSHWTVEC